MSSHQQWEYLVKANGVDLDTLGSEGWELVTVDRNVYYFKRPKGSAQFSPTEYAQGSYD